MFDCAFDATQIQQRRQDILNLSKASNILRRRKITIGSYKILGEYLREPLKKRHAQLFERFAQVAASNINEFTPQGLSQTVWAYSKLNLSKHSLLLAAASAAMGTEMVAGTAHDRADERNPPQGDGNPTDRRAAP